MLVVFEPSSSSRRVQPSRLVIRQGTRLIESGRSVPHRRGETRPGQVERVPDRRRRASNSSGPDRDLLHNRARCPDIRDQERSERGLQHDRKLESRPFWIPADVQTKEKTFAASETVIATSESVDPSGQSVRGRRNRGILGEVLSMQNVIDSDLIKSSMLVMYRPLPLALGQ